MEEQYITFEVAQLAKEKGFDIGVNQSYVLYKESYDYDDDPNHRESYKVNDIEVNSHYHVNNYKGIDLSNELYEAYSAPNQALLQKWLREVHQIYVDVDIDQTTYPKFCYMISRFIGNPTDLSAEEWGWENLPNGVDWGTSQQLGRCP